jgi:hypothetical protein
MEYFRRWYATNRYRRIDLNPDRPKRVLVFRRSERAVEWCNPMPSRQSILDCFLGFE